MPGQIGNKGGGRKSVYEEWNKANAINKLWEKVNKKVMAGDSLTEYEEKLVLAVLPKTIKTEMKAEVDGNININLVNYDPDNNNTLQIQTEELPDTTISES